MIVDTSAVMAILFGESDAEFYDTAMAKAPSRRMSVANFLEATMVFESHSGTAAGNALDSYLQEAQIDLEPVPTDQVQAARRAWRRFGKGNHPAGLNFGDCFAYALAEISQEPLLFKGDDFALADVQAA